MAKRIAVLQGHPDPAGEHFCNALADAYADGALAARHEVRRVDVAKLDFPVLHGAADFYEGATPAGVRGAQEAIFWADHLVIVYPLWFGHFPALLHAFIEQTFRPAAVATDKDGHAPKKPFRGKSARIVVTMGMPGLFYRWYFRAHGLKSLERNVLQFLGVRPVRSTLIGLLGSGAVGSAYDRDFPIWSTAASRARWLEKLRSLGRRAR